MKKGASVELSGETLALAFHPTAGDGVGLSPNDLALLGGEVCWQVEFHGRRLCLAHQSCEQTIDHGQGFIPVFCKHVKVTKSQLAKWWSTPLKGRSVLDMS